MSADQERTRISSPPGRAPEAGAGNTGAVAPDSASPFSGMPDGGQPGHQSGHQSSPQPHHRPADQTVIASAMPAAPTPGAMHPGFGAGQQTIRGHLPEDAHPHGASASGTHGAGASGAHAVGAGRNPIPPTHRFGPAGVPAMAGGGVTHGLGGHGFGGHGFGGVDDTWLGHGIPSQSNPPRPHQPYHAPQNPGDYWPGRQIPASPFMGGMGGNMAEIGQASAADPGFFPRISQDMQQQAPMTGPRIPLMAALQVKGLGQGSASNPLIAAAASLLILLGRLRTGLVEMQAAPLMDHVTREIDAFERNALMAGVAPHEALVAKYALSGTADDIVQNLPGADRGNWLQYSMVARFFHKRDSGVGFFQEVEKAMQAPGQHYDLLELMLACLSLGFEGQFRTIPNGGVELARIRQAIYETLRRVRPRPDEDISPIWAPVEIGRRRRWRAIPLTMLLGAGAFLILLTFVLLSMWLSRDGAAITADLRGVNAARADIAIARQVWVAPPPPATTSQIERIRKRLDTEIENLQLEVVPRGDYIAIRLGNLQMFDFSSITLRPEFTPLAVRIAEVLNEEGGPVLVQGHTDDVPVKPTSRFRSNDNLSLLRAEAVRDVLAGLVDDPARLAVEGRGAAEPIADNASEDGRARNRRVEILLQREGVAVAPGDSSAGDGGNQGDEDQAGGAG